MYIDKIMSKNIVSVKGDTSLNHMIDMMHKFAVHHLPVVDEGNSLIGVISHEDIQKATPSDISTLSIGESKHLLLKITAQQIMKKNVVTCVADTLIEDAGRLLRDNNISSLPVVDNKNKLIGIITTDDVLDFFLDITGCMQENTYRLSARLTDEKGALSNFLMKITDNNAYISTVVSPTYKDKKDDRRVCIVRYKTDNNEYLIKELKEKGYNVEQKI
ncbi:MAG: hypothetical protein DRQ51_05610 [Gammaproteobacteria bacterium]|nr:MAG: hypothetical protein DRQ51_05610 [Gammaproteobacteria bacterium]